MSSFCRWPIVLRGSADAAAFRRQTPRSGQAELLLQERIPRSHPFYRARGRVVGSRQAAGGDEGLLRVYTSPNTPTPGSAAPLQRPIHRDGDRRRRGLQPLERARRHALARRRHAGQSRAVLLSPRAVDRPRLVHLLPANAPPADSYEAIFSQSRAEFRRRDGDFDTHTEIAVSPEDDVELRRITVNNRSREPRTIETHELRGSCSTPPPRPTRPTRPSASCSSRPKSCRPGRRSCARVGPGRQKTRRRSCSTLWWCTRRRTAKCPTKPID